MAAQIPIPMSETGQAQTVHKDVSIHPEHAYTSSRRNSVRFKMFFGNLNKQAKAILTHTSTPKHVKPKSSKHRFGFPYRGLSFKRNQKAASISSSGSDVTTTTARVRCKPRHSLLLDHPPPKKRSFWRLPFTLRPNGIKRLTGFYRQQPMQESLSQISLQLMKEKRGKQPRAYIQEPFKGLPPLRPPSPIMTPDEIEDMVGVMCPHSELNDSSSNENRGLALESKDPRESSQIDSINHTSKFQNIPAQLGHKYSHSYGGIPARYHDSQKHRPSVYHRRYSDELCRSNSFEHEHHPWMYGAIENVNLHPSTPSRYQPALRQRSQHHTETLEMSWEKLNSKQVTPEQIYLLANEIANHRIKKRRMMSQFELLKAKKRARNQFDTGVRVRMSLCRNNTSTASESYNYNYYNGLRHMELETRVSHVNSKQKHQILDHSVIYDPRNLDEHIIQCQTARAKYHLMRPNCAAYLNRILQGYGTYLPKGQFMSNLILLNSQDRIRQGEREAALDVGLPTNGKCSQLGQRQDTRRLHVVNADSPPIPHRRRSTLSQTRSNSHSTIKTHHHAYLDHDPSFPRQNPSAVRKQNFQQRPFANLEHPLRQSLVC